MLAIPDRDSKHHCPDPSCGALMFRLVEAPFIKPDLGDFSHMNGGRGIYNPQIQKHVRHVNEVVDEAKKRGLSYEKA